MGGGYCWSNPQTTGHMVLAIINKNIKYFFIVKQNGQTTFSVKNLESKTDIHMINVAKNETENDSLCFSIKRIFNLSLG